MEIAVTLSANAGVAICAQGCRVWVDAVHDRKIPGFSTVTPQLKRAMLGSEAFQNPEHILFTHCHPDHYSHDLTLAAAAIWPKAKLYLPEQVFPEQTLMSGQTCWVSHELSLSFIRLPHAGEQFANVIHYGVILRIGDKNVFLSGDCDVANPALAQALAGEKIHLAILNFPWITLKKGREFIKKYLPEAKLLLCHLPFEQDDINGYRFAAQKTVEQCPEVRLLMEPLQTETVII